MTANVLFLRRMLKDFPVSVRAQTRKYRLVSDSDRLVISRIDGGAFGTDLAARLNQIFEGELQFSEDDCRWRINPDRVDQIRCQQTTDSA